MFERLQPLVRPGAPSSEEPKPDIAELASRVERDRTRRLVTRWLPKARGSPVKRRAAIVFAIAGVLSTVLTAVLLFGGGPEPERAPPLPIARAAPVSSAPPSAAAELVVSVIGKVVRPGLVTLPAGARVADAVRAAGGALPDTDLATVNLARRLSDGEQLDVGAPPQAQGPAPTSPGAGPEVKVDLNTASLAQLDDLPGVGEVTAQRILDWRNKHGRFTAVEQLREVEGIGETRFTRLRDQVTVR
ncbi:ComEA family DNA-binding protein [Amycolatopsis sp. YIM 10]|uniref:ComEA family DNA-binding protein n=1 Tax=Amycolatopsis sp. YIM 10 TaxID=2653857 RepID=UPI00128FE983|nr:ComEA family DNA-binding protein [Amycolatopsis sp. YIM 10]